MQPPVCRYPGRHLLAIPDAADLKAVLCVCVCVFRCSPPGRRWDKYLHDVVKPSRSPTKLCMLHLQPSHFHSSDRIFLTSAASYFFPSASPTPLAITLVEKVTLCNLGLFKGTWRQEKTTNQITDGTRFGFVWCKRPRRSKRGYKRRLKILERWAKPARPPLLRQPRLTSSGETCWSVTRRRREEIAHQIILSWNLRLKLPADATLSWGVMGLGLVGDP
jgi:hypothetical protein